MKLKKILKSLMVYLYALLVMAYEMVWTSYAKPFIADERGDVTAKRAVGYCISFFLLGILFPIGMDAIMNSTTTSWNAGVKTMFQVVCPILCVIGIALDYLGKI